MFGTSPAKVAKKIDSLVEELRIIGDRIAGHEEQFQMAKRLGLARDGEDDHIRLWRRVQTQLVTKLPEAKAAVLSGEEDYRQINRVLRMTHQQIKEVAADISAADRAAEMGRKMARDRFGSKQ
ncbi:hypothetical protein [Erythrobacter sp. HL-111]|uniref:hypothetical protein n=1 Tax=Erythrobacter sp. HL-111 TaxID=1798193 RepID=UPI0006DADC5B|nr:hypothetical protein [Erythrobacter sp. HL-111]KPP86982.1 MAG: hypothetical protein HLUCCO15_12525 [Erythrobacteraceae bacterium HL-111]